ncbi:ATP-binding protein [Endozoicomonas sp. 4G]|uniref:AAA family ATPase n=1 Tax=Endozoicomonas sp. 4G TaxID=2872754 RepID=UPI0020786F81|nr:ATP-binding protein [Endozoicomonas sp. 4G]
MIVDFTIENFRSIKDEQVFSLYADRKPKHHPGNISYVDGKIGLLKTTAIYGANASGKTNLILALDALKKLVIESGSWKDGEEIEAYEPYRLSKDTFGSPTNFEIEFYVNKNRYRYQIKFDAFDIIYESLDLYKTTKPSNIFTRNSPTDWKGVKFGDSYKGGKRQFAFFSNNSYLSKAGNSPDSPSFLRDIYNYFRKNILIMLTDHSFSMLDWANKSGYKKVVNSFLSKADLGISKFDFVKQELPENLSLPEHFPEEVKGKFIKEFSRREVFYHKSDFGDLVEFDKGLESKGTIKLFRLVPFFAMVLSKGASLFIDEIESSLHPHIAELIIKLFNDPTVNVNNAQLVFTTHDISLMSQDILRKDQVYLSGKNHGSGTEYLCIEQFDNSLKDSSPFSKWYNEGRLGGIPEFNYKEISDSLKEVIRRA